MTDEARWTSEELRGMSLGELLDGWDEPMPAEARATLLSELDARGYRTSSLEAPPEPGSVAQAPVPHAERLEIQRQRRVRNGSLIVLLVGALTLLGAVVAVFGGNEAFQAREDALAQRVQVEGETETVAELRSELRVERIVVLYVPFGLAGAFLALYFWSRSSPRLALPLAFVLYAGLQGLGFAAQAEVRPRRLFVPILFTIGLGAAAFAAWKAPTSGGSESDEFWEDA